MRGIFATTDLVLHGLNPLILNGTSSSIHPFPLAAAAAAAAFVGLSQWRGCAIACGYTTTHFVLSRNTARRVSSTLGGELVLDLSLVFLPLYSLHLIFPFILICLSLSLNSDIANMASSDLVDHSPHHPTQAAQLNSASNVILIDNYDSFTWNVYQYLVLEGATVNRLEKFTIRGVVSGEELRAATTTFTSAGVLDIWVMKFGLIMGKGFLH